MPDQNLIQQIDACLPQTQCGQCGYEGCLPYAEAISESQANINQCPPGGTVTITQLADLLDRPILALNPQNGKHASPSLATIREDECIGCTKCIQACPVDAIMGAAKQMHSVISDVCTGCELCIAPCPVDCIDLTPSKGHPLQSENLMLRDLFINESRDRYDWHRTRLDRDLQRKRSKKLASQFERESRDQKKQMQDEIQAAIARSKARKKAK